MENFIRGIARNWYLELIRGILFVAAGVWVFMTPASSYVALALFFAITFLITGILEISYVLSNRKHLEGWGWTLVGGIVQTLIGLLLVSHPLLTMAVLPFYVGFALLFRSSMAIGLAIELGRIHVPDWGVLLFMGLLGMISSFIMLWNPALGGLTIVAYTALAFLSVGIFNMYLSFQLKKLNKEMKMTGT